MIQQSRISAVLIALLSLLSLFGCAGTRETENTFIAEIIEARGYRWLTSEAGKGSGENIVLLAFSGGGTRVAALSYGVLQELRDTLIAVEGGEISLLDEIDTISSVSGGSFTSAYYGLFREKIFEDFETEFLRRGVQQDLVNELLRPAYWLRSNATGFNRTEMAIEHYEKNIFKGATFADMEANGPPYIEINATDLTTGMRFTFNQERFDLICSDLEAFSVARAVTASSAVPVVFPTVPLRNHADQCDLSDSREWAMLEAAEKTAQTSAQRQALRNLKSYRNAKDRKYIHLVDGGVSDNLGLRAIIDKLEGVGASSLEMLKKNPPKSILIIAVNAEVKRSYTIEQTAEEPSIASSMSAYTSAQMHGYNLETLDRLRRDIADLERKFEVAGMGTRVYFAEVSFDQVKSKEVNRLLNSLPTSLELDDVQVDRLIGTGRLMLRSEPSYQQFMEHSAAHLVEGAVSKEEICAKFDHSPCKFMP